MQPHTLQRVLWTIVLVISTGRVSADSNMFTTHMRDGCEIRVLNTGVEIPPRQHVYYRRMREGEHPLSTLMRESSLIIIARATSIAMTEEGGRVTCEYGFADPFCLWGLQVEECLAATMDKRALSALLTTWRGRSNMLFYAQHLSRPSHVGTHTRDRRLYRGSQYLFFLKEYPGCSQDLIRAQCEVQPAVVFKAVLHDKGVLLLNKADSDKTLRFRFPAPEEKCDDSASVKAIFGTDDAARIVQGVHCLALAMCDESGTCAVRREAAFDRARPLLPFGDDPDVHSLTNYARFKYVK